MQQSGDAFEVQPLMPETHVLLQLLRIKRAPLASMTTLTILLKGHAACGLMIQPAVAAEADSVLGC